MRKTYKPLIYLFIFLVLMMPVVTLAQGGWQGLVPCGTDANPAPCGFKDIMTLINKVINFVLFALALPIAAIMFAYAGFLLINPAGGEQKTKAKNIFTSAVIGLVVAACAWLIINTILSILGYDGDWIGF